MALSATQRDRTTRVTELPLFVAGKQVA